ncbi:uncharacterized protein DNG_06585 [Cephalotrichum gorgonifer]|uniref:Uncharacterized protein n=1 Tax=Cephalotrichum gorgonifer TaxID=2041049 RepID=A0AAE8SXF6_9PEZI|nr:uncharacterized protein DNG_06585 [Cephalotrichum gorgonifer]
MDTTTTASSIPKESDKLHDEIFHSLAPPGAPGEIAGESRAYQRKSTIDGIRESTYLPSVYDDYWATTAEDERHPAVPEVLRLPAGATVEAAVAPLRPGAKSPGAPASPQPLRKRFSWEQNEEANAVPPASTQSQSSEAPVEPPADVSHSPAQEAGSQPKPEEGKATEAGTTEGSDSEKGLTSISRHGSQISKTKGGDSEERSKEQNRLSLAGEKLLMGASDEHLPTEPILEDHPALRDSARYSPEHLVHDPAQDLPKESPKDMPTSKSANLPSFREIMALGTSRERTAKFDETRSQFAGIDEGLSDWIATLKEMPEHAGASVIFNANGLPAPINSTPSAQGQQSHATVSLGQPQPYIGASSPTGGAFGRPISTSLGSSTPASVFKHSSNQAGVKSKELLLAAGKAGKGLLSKGKNKLRGSTGDKNDSSPSQSQPKPPSDGPTSWGAKFVAGAGGPTQSSTPPPDPAQQPNATASSPAPHLPTGRPGPDGAALASLRLPPPGSIFADPELVSPVSDINSRISSDGDDVFAPQSIKASNSTPVDKPQPWVPTTASPLAGQGQSPITSGLGAPGGDGATEEVKSDPSNDWAATSPHQLTEHAQTGARKSSDNRSVNRPERVSDTDTAGHAPTSQSDDPKRSLSFAGLPPIRRSSTFGLALGETARVDEDNSLHDGSDENRGTHEPHVDVIPTISDAPPVSDVRSDEPVEAATLEGQTLGNDYPTTEGAALELVKQKNLSDDPSEQPAAVDKAPTTGDAVTAAAPSSDEPPTLMAPAEPTTTSITSDEQPPAIPPTSEQQSSLSSAGPSLVRSPPPHIAVSPIQKLPPNGQWKMQESYLSEPLISPSRKRPTSASSQSPSFVGFEKETGVGLSEERADSSDDGSIAGKAGKAGPQENQKQVYRQEDSLKDTQAVESRAEGPLPSAANPAPTGAPHNQPLQPGPSSRPKYGATPPVAMQRYRGLFAPKQPPMPVYTHPPEAPSQSQQDVAECSGALPTHISGAPPARPSSRPSTADGKGRRSSGIFGPIGDRFAKINADLASQSGPNRAGEAANDDASETSVPAVGQRHRRRSSFFLNLRGSSTQNSGHPTGDSMAVISPSAVEHGSQPSPPPEESHKRSFFSTSKGRISTGVSSRFPPVLSRSSTANVEGNAAKGQGQGQGRARFGGFGMFKRSTGLQDSVSLQEKPGSAGSMVPSIQSRPATGTVALPEPSASNLPPTQSSSQPPPEGAGSLISLPAPPTRGHLPSQMSGVVGLDACLRGSLAHSPALSMVLLQVSGRSSKVLRRLLVVHSMVLLINDKHPHRNVPGPPPLLITARSFRCPPTPAQRQSTLDKVSPGQQIIMSTAQKNQLPLMEQANQGQQMQDWRPVPVQQPEVAEPSTEPALKRPNQGRALVERRSHGGLAHAGLVGGTDTVVSEPKGTHDADSSIAPPVETSTEKNGGPLHEAKAKGNASDAAATTPDTARVLSVDEPGQTDKDVASSLTSINDPSALPSPTRPSATLAPQQASSSSRQDLPKNLQLEGAPISATESIKLDLRGAPASSAELAKSDPSRSPQLGSVSTQSPHPSPSKHRTSTGQTLSQPASAVEQAGARADQGQEQPVQVQASPQGQLPSQLRSGQLPGQPLRGQPYHNYALQPNAQQGQWRPFMPQELMPPNQHHGQPPWAMNRPAPEVSNAFGPQNISSPAHFHAIAGPHQSPQPQQNEGQSSVSKWFKGISSGQPQRQQTQQQPVPAKLEKPKSLFSAFKRASKQADTRPPETTQPQFVPGQSQHPVFASGGYPQQYHPQQSMNPAWAITPSQHQDQMSQYRPAMPHQGGQQFAQAAYQFQPAPGQVLYTPGQPTQLQQHAPSQVLQGPSITPSRQTSMASSNQPRLSVASESPIVQSPHPIGTQTNQGPPAEPAVLLGSQLQQATALTTQFGKDPRPLVSTNVNKPLPTPRLLHQQERASDVSQTSSISSAPTPPAEGVSTTVAVLEQAVRSPFVKPVDRKTLEHDGRTDSQGSLAPSVAGSSKKLTVDTEAAKRRSNETNLYDATPRGIPARIHDATPTSGEGPSTGVQISSRSLGGAQDSQTTVSSGVQVQAHPRTPTTAQDSQTTTVPEEASDSSQPTQPTLPADPLAQPTDQATQHTQTTDQAEPVESKQQAIIRKMRLDAQEEKILVPGQDGLPGAAEQDDDRPHMSATSYPGQEWNPYGGGYDFYQD